MGSSAHVVGRLPIRSLDTSLSRSVMTEESDVPLTWEDREEYVVGQLHGTLFGALQSARGLNE